MIGCHTSQRISPFHQATPPKPKSSQPNSLASQRPVYTHRSIWSGFFLSFLHHSPEISIIVMLITSHPKKRGESQAKALAKASSARKTRTSSPKGRTNLERWRPKRDRNSSRKFYPLESKREISVLPSVAPLYPVLTRNNKKCARFQKTWCSLPFFELNLTTLMFSQL